MERSNSGENNVLVRRVKNRSDETKNGSNGNDDDDSTKNVDCEEEIDDCDSKETRLTLMEEVLLLGLKDKEVSWVE
jgi:golgi phosphoprotein 3